MAHYFKQRILYKLCERYGIPFLPAYKILNLEKEGSLHEYIDGENPRRISAKEEIDNMEESDFKSTLTKHLNRLESVCRAIGLTDLHHENILFTKNGMIVPIDIEAIDLSKETGLFGLEEKAPKFDISNSEEISLIEIFNNTTKEVPHRFVPLPTNYFEEMISNYEGYMEIAKDLIAALRNGSWKIILDYEILLKLLKLDFSNGDIPYFTIKNNMLYYGKYQEILLAMMEKEDKA